MFAQIFIYSNLFVLPAWGLLIFFPGWRWTRLVAAYVTPALLAFAYLALMLILHPSGGFGSFDQYVKMLQSPEFLLVGWLHFLCFDLFVGAWEVRDSQRLRISHALVVPCLVLTFLVGPVGMVAYYVIRVLKVRQLPE